VNWRDVCAVEQLQVGRGVAALLGGRQVALFRTEDAVYAIDNLDPCSGVAVLSRGIVGDRGGEPVVASPLYKQSFSLVSGRCLDEPGREVEVFDVRIANGRVQVKLP
jgi:nitrite reductase (NADH) small subunit